MKNFTQLLTDLRILYRIIHNLVQGKENLKQLHANTEAKIFWEEYEPVLSKYMQILYKPEETCKKDDYLFKICEKVNAGITLLQKSELILALYNWLISHKPKLLRDTIMFELSVVGAKNLSEPNKTLFAKFIWLQEKILTECEMPIVDKSTDPDNLPCKVFFDFNKFITDFNNLLIS